MNEFVNFSQKVYLKVFVKTQFTYLMKYHVLERCEQNKVQKN